MTARKDVKLTPPPPPQSVRSDHESVRLKIEFGQRFRQERERVGWTASDVARLLGCSPGTVANVEKGEHAPHILFVRKVCEAWGISADTLLGLATESQSKGRGKPKSSKR